jgi:hypothetical protein
MSLWLPCGLHGFAVPNTVTVIVFLGSFVRLFVTTSGEEQDECRGFSDSPAW